MLVGPLGARRLKRFWHVDVEEFPGVRFKGNLCNRLSGYEFPQKIRKQEL